MLSSPRCAPSSSRSCSSPGGRSKGVPVEALADGRGRARQRRGAHRRDRRRAGRGLLGAPAWSASSAPRSMEEAVALATAIARERTPATVLLSPAAASFDMFRDYEARGAAFKAAVAELADAGRTDDGGPALPLGSDDEQPRGRTQRLPPAQGSRAEQLALPAATHGGARQPRAPPPQRPARSAVVAGDHAATPWHAPPVTPPARPPATAAAGRVVKGPQRERHEPDYLLMVAAVGALGHRHPDGLLQPRPRRRARQAASSTRVTTQLGWGLLGGLVLVLVMRIDYRYWRSFSVLGIVHRGGPAACSCWVPASRRCCEPIRRQRRHALAARSAACRAFQPTELAKLALVVFLAHWLGHARQAGGHASAAACCRSRSLVGVVAALVLLEPDLGTTGVLVLTAFTMFFVAGGSIWQLAAAAAGGRSPAVAGVVADEAVHAATASTIFIDPFADAAGAGYQTVRGHLRRWRSAASPARALASASSRLACRCRPLRTTSSSRSWARSSASSAACIVIGLFLLLAWRGMRVAMNAPDTFGGLLALGITAWLTFQAFINIAVVVSLIPMTGMPLPFLSDGGTSLVVVLAAVGILLSISRETVTRGASAHEDPHRSRGHGRPHLPRPGRRDPAADPSA